MSSEVETSLIDWTSSEIRSEIPPLRSESQNGTWKRPRMTVHHDQLQVRTNGKGLYEITDEVQSKIDRCGVRNGTVTVFVQHTSCSMIMMENADPTARRDLEEFFDRLVPEDADYFTHGSEGGDDMPSHI